MLRKLWEWIKHPHGWVLIPFYIFTIACVAGAIGITASGQTENYEIIAYILYAFAAVTLGYTIYTLVVFVPEFKRNTVAVIRKNSFINRLFEHYGFRTIIFAGVALIISLANAIINGVIGIVYLSVWYLALGAYYILLSAMRGGVLIYHGKKKKYAVDEPRGTALMRELRTYSICGILLILLPLALSFAIMEMVATNRAFIRSGMMIYVAAAYTFYKIVMSVINFFKARKGDEITVRAIRNVNLADALVSILALQTAMFHEFSEGESFGLANAVTGAVVCAVTAAIGIFMLVNGRLQIRKLLTEDKDTNE